MKTTSSRPRPKTQRKREGEELHKRKQEAKKRLLDATGEDEILAALAASWWLKLGEESPPPRGPTADTLKKWLLATASASAKMQELLGGLGAAKRWQARRGADGAVDLDRPLSPAEAGNPPPSEWLPNEALPLTEIHARWVQERQTAEKKPLHPLATIVLEWLQHRTTPLEERHVITVTDREDRRYNRTPALVDLATLSPIEAILVDGVPLVSGGLASYGRVRPRPQPSADDQGALPFPFAGPRTIDDTSVNDLVIRTLATLPKPDLRTTLFGDVHKLSALVFALTGFGPIPEELGAAFVGGADTLANRRRWWDACRFLHNVTIIIDEQTHAWLPLARVEVDDQGRVLIGPPAWWRGHGKNSRWRFSGTLFRSSRIGGAGGRGGGAANEHHAGLARTLAGLEAHLCYSRPSGRGRGGRVPTWLKPTRRGGPGPQVFVPWRGVLILSGENVPFDSPSNGPDGRRYRNRVATLRKAGYVAPAGGGAAQAMDTVEIIKIVQGGKHHRGGLWIRASARFCEAASGARAWERLSVRQVLPGPPEMFG